MLLSVSLSALDAIRTPRLGARSAPSASRRRCSRSPALEAYQASHGLAATPAWADQTALGLLSDRGGARRSRRRSPRHSKPRALRAQRAARGE
jgi:hypothetical protein